jgi:GDP-mannose 6-dehydrogenase
MEEMVIRSWRARAKSREDLRLLQPGFLREGTSIEDFYNPPYTVIGASDPTAAEALKEVYAIIDAPLMVVPIKVAEMVKYVNNTFHALKVTFANEIGDICKQQNIDSHQVMEIF